MTMPFGFGLDINNPNASQFSRGAVPNIQPTLEGIVEDVVINEGKTPKEILRYKPDGSNIGQILVRVIPNDLGLPLIKLRKALPMNMQFMEYPLVGEMVLLTRAFGNLYYTNKINPSRNVNNGVAAILRQQFGQNTPTSNTPQNRQLLAQGVVSTQQLEATNDYAISSTPGKYFRLQTIPQIRPTEGDVIIQGRFGNSIRLGSSLFHREIIGQTKPNILLTAGLSDAREYSTPTLNEFSLTFENINKDKSSIWMVSDQKVVFTPATVLSTSPIKAHMLSSINKPSTYDGAQIFINSDRVILNSKQNEISLFSNNEINLSSIKAITLDTENKIFLRAFQDISIKADGIISLNGKSLTFIADDLSYKTTGNYTITGKNIFIGRHNDTTQPMVLGASLALWLNSLLTQILTPGAFLTPMGPAILNPAVSVQLAQLKAQLGSTTNPQAAVFNSKNNFTADVNSV